MRGFFSQYRSFDWFLIAGVAGAITLGFLAIASVDLSRNTSFN
jgi:hypothetical protein